MSLQTAIASKERHVRLGVLLLLISAGFLSVTRAQAPTDVPTLLVIPEDSSISFSVKSSVNIEGQFSKWDANVTFASTDPTTGALTITIQAASVNTGSGMKDGKLKSKDFFYVEEDPTITYKSTKLSQTGPRYSGTWMPSVCLSLRQTPWYW
jgi:polyisoprenoid-binding protein YceI